MNYTPIKGIYHFLQATLKVYNILQVMSRASFEESGQQHLLWLLFTPLPVTAAFLVLYARILQMLLLKLLLP